MPESPVVLCTDRQGNVYEELSVAALKDVSWVLNGVGKATFVIPQNHPFVEIPEPMLNEIQIRFPDIDRPWWGPVMRVRENASYAEFECETLETYFHKRYVDHETLNWPTLTDQIDIAWGIVGYAQAFGTNKYLYIERDPDMPLSGKMRLRNYPRADHRNIFDILTEFTNLVDHTTGVPNGFDWEVRGTLDNQRLFTAYYPERGTAVHDEILEFGHNISNYEVTVDGSQLCTKAYVTGGMSGSIKMENNYVDAVYAALYGEFVDVLSESDQLDPIELGAIARSHVEMRKTPPVFPTIKAIRVPYDWLGRVWPGDRVHLVIQHGRTNIDDNFRIREVKWVASSNSVDLSFIPRVS